MKRKMFVILLVAILSIGSGIYGILIGDREYFPYRYLKDSKDYMLNVKIHWWKIGIYTGTSPFDLKPSKKIKNPILTANDVTDIKAQFLADPFLVKSDSLFYIFFEVGNMKTHQGDIGYAESKDGINWKYQKIVIDEPFHLSFPYVFKYKNDYYMMPESHLDLSVRLYIATKFPSEWKYEKNLISGYHFVDPQIIRYKNLWWLFVCSTGNDNLNIYYSKNLGGPYVQHPKSPVLKHNPHLTRGAGRIIEYNGKLFRFAQDDYPSYGRKVYVFEITKLTTTDYKEKLAQKDPILKADKAGTWNSLGMHTITPIQIDKNKWISAVDGF